MSWHRIDENTYIDDTLVTCAEYQLFIDEMREKGMCYQPDHWSSYQFLEGQAREPILGVRPSDAIAFCEWLTKREVEKWIFRLSSSAEAGEYLIKSHYDPLHIGYWVKGANNQCQFFWIDSIPNEPRKIILNRASDRVSALDFPLTLNRALDLDHALDLARSVNHLELTGNLDFALNRGRILDLNRGFDLNHVLGLARARNLNRDFDLNHTLYYDLTLSRALNHDDTLDLYIDIFTLQERIAGRSPAFEGIRLVKERIR